MSTKDNSKCQESVESPDRDRGTKRPVENTETEVHSANDWEHANLGGDDRKQKFLRLMGANKKQHGGRFVIGDGSNKHRARSDEETQKVTQDLEEQFQDSMDHKLSGATRKHFGLGFSGDEQEENKKTDSDTDKGAAGSTEVKAAPDSPSKADHDTAEEKAGDKEDSTKGERERDKPKMLNFVKASS